MKVLFSESYKPIFKSDIRIDVGGSQSEGSCKIDYTSTSKNELFSHVRTTVNQLGKNNFDGSIDFVGLLIGKIKKTQNENISKVKESGYGEDENIIKNVAIFVPSTTYGNVAKRLPNLKDSNDKPLEDVNFSNFKERLIDNGVKVSEDMKFILLQDVMGAGLYITKRLYEEGMLELGDAYTVCVTGGGCGITDIKMTDPEGITLMSSGSSCLSSDSELQKVSKEGASAPALIHNFCEHMWFDKYTTANIVSCHKAEIVMFPSISLEKNIKTDKLKKLLLSTNKYEFRDDDNKYTISVKNEYLEDFDKARKFAIKKYADAIARLAVIKRNESSNGIIITGQLARAVNNVSNECYGKSLSSLIKQGLKEKYNSFDLQKLADSYPFEVLCDSRFDLNDNTACGNLVHKAKFIGQHRFNWIRINIKDIEQSILKTTKKLI